MAEVSDADWLKGYSPGQCFEVTIQTPFSWFRLHFGRWYVKYLGADGQLHELMVSAWSVPSAKRRGSKRANLRLHHDGRGQ